jgi:flagellar FliJ protein
VRRFRFSLQTLLRVRQHREQAARRAVAELAAARASAEGALERARAALHEAETDLRRANDAPTLTAAAAVMGFRRRQANEAARRLRELQEHLAREMARFLLVKKERRVVERLRERRLEMHRIAEAHRAQAQLDEIAVSRHQRGEP